MSQLDGASDFEVYLLAQSILKDARNNSGFSSLAIADGTKSLGRALVELSARLDVRVMAGAQDAAAEAEFAALGVDCVIRSDRLDFVEEVMSLTDGQGVDLILDQVGGPGFERNFDMLADFGDIVVTGWADGDPPHLFETMWAKLDRCPCIQLWTLDRYRSLPERLEELRGEVRAYLGTRAGSHSETKA